MPKRKMNPASLDNLSKHRFSSEEARKAAEKSAEVRKVYRPIKDIFNEGLDDETVKQIFAALKEKALAGDVRAWESLRDSSGQKPKEEVQMDNTVRLYFDDPDAEDFSG